MIAVKSGRGVAAALAFLLAFPIAAVVRAVAPDAVGGAIHLALAAGAALLALAVGDFATPRWATWVGRVSSAALAMIFGLQAGADLPHDSTLARLAYEVLGQRLERVLGDLILLWCIVVLAVDSRGKTRWIGGAALTIAVTVEVVALALSAVGNSLNTTMPLLALLSLLPFVWLLAESLKTTRRTR